MNKPSLLDIQARLMVSDFDFAAVFATHPGSDRLTGQGLLQAAESQSAT